MYREIAQQKGGDNMPTEVEVYQATIARLTNRRQEFLTKIRAIDEKIRSAQDLLAFCKSGEIESSVIDLQEANSRRRKHGSLQIVISDTLATFGDDEIIAPAEVASRIREKHSWNDSNLYNCVFTGMRRMTTKGLLEWLPGKGFIKMKEKPQSATG